MSGWPDSMTPMGGPRIVLTAEEWAHIEERRKKKAEKEQAEKAQAALPTPQLIP